MTPTWVLAGLICWGACLFILILGMLKAASDQDDLSETYHEDLLNNTPNNDRRND